MWTPCRARRAFGSAPSIDRPFTGESLLALIESAVAVSHDEPRAPVAAKHLPEALPTEWIDSLASCSISATAALVSRLTML